MLIIERCPLTRRDPVFEWAHAVVIIYVCECMRHNKLPGNRAKDTWKAAEQ